MVLDKGITADQWQLQIRRYEPAHRLSVGVSCEEQTLEA